jgi:hypothetical protein
MTTPDLKQLEALTLDELEALWDALPTEQQAWTKRRYHAALHAKGIADDAGELRLIDAYLKGFREEGLLPAGERWLKLSSAMRERFADGETTLEAEAAPVKPRKPKLLPLLLLLGGALFLILIAGRALDGDETVSASIAVTPTPTLTATADATPTATPTATPLALYDTDRYVEAGDGRRDRDFYPTLLRVEAPLGEPRVYVVQERLVGASEWRYEANPDVASWLGGLLVAPVLGLPAGGDNAALFATFSPGTEVVLRMNTGAELRFALTQKRDVPRTATQLFDQREPGLTLLLLGPAGADGLPNATRPALSGRYLAAQELQALGAVAELPLPLGGAALLDDLTATVVQSLLLPEVIEITLGLRYEAAALLDGYDWLLQGADGLRYPALNALSVAQASAADTPLGTLRFRRPPSTDDLRLLLVGADGAETRFALDLQAPPDPPDADDLDLQLKGVWHDTETVIVEARLYNPTAEPINFDAAAAWLVPGYSANPPGPRAPPLDAAAHTLAPDTALDVALRFAWNGRDPFAAFGLAGRHFAVTLLPE